VVGLVVLGRASQRPAWAACADVPEGYSDKPVIQLPEHSAFHWPTAQSPVAVVCLAFCPKKTRVSGNAHATAPIPRRTPPTMVDTIFAFLSMAISIPLGGQ
jgi:hypothetical protein